MTHGRVVVSHSITMDGTTRMPTRRGWRFVAPVVGVLVLTPVGVSLVVSLQFDQGPAMVAGGAAFALASMGLVALLAARARQRRGEARP